MWQRATRRNLQVYVLNSAKFGNTHCQLLLPVDWVTLHCLTFFVVVVQLLLISSGFLRKPTRRRGRKLFVTLTPIFQ